MKNMTKILIALAIAGVITVALVLSTRSDGKSEKTARLVYVNWAEGVAYTHVAQVVLEEKMGYDVTITSEDVAPAYASVAQGDYDVYMETWPVLDAYYLDQYTDSLYAVGKIYEGTRVGLVIPRYMAEDGVTTISDLKKPEVLEKLNGEITGIDSGAGMMLDIEDKIMPGYGLDKAGYELVASSGPAMTAALKSAVENKEYIVVAGWTPHWKFGVWDLLFLEQDGPQVWGVGDILLSAHSGLEESKPELARFLEKIYLTDEEMSKLLVAYKNADDIPSMAKEWVEANPSVWEDWIP